MKRLSILALAILFSLFLVSNCGEGDGVDITDDGLEGQVTIPLLPIDLPIFPTDITLEGAADSFYDEVEEYLGWLFGEDDVEDALDWLEDELRDASLEILQPGVLSVEVKNVVTDAIRDIVEVTRVGVNFEFKNNTDKYIDVPVEFQLFLGDGDLAEAWDESVMIPFADPRVDEDGNFIVAPGESIELSIENVPHLVDALNNSDSIGVGYKALYRMADTENGADVMEAIDKFGLCIAGKVTGLDLGGECPSAQDLISWHLALKKFELVVEAEATFDIPEIPYCDEFADSLNLDLLKDACEESGE